MGLVPKSVEGHKMQKSKSPSPGHRILPRKWRKIKLAHSKSAPAASSMWTPEGNCQWSSMSGQQVTLSVMNLLQLSEVEILALQKITLAKLQAMELGCPITIPKDALLSQKSRKRSGFTLRRRPISGTNLVGLWDNIKGKDSKDSRKSIVFGIPLSKCLAHDRELRRRKATLLRERRESLDLAQLPRNMRKSSSSSGGAFSSDSLPDLEQRHGGSSLLEALSLTSSTSQLETKWKESHESLQPHTTEVPYVVNMCCKHIETYGLHILGIFRIGSSKKRTKQLKEEFESGEDVKLSKDHNPHEVGALLKEFFRDLPDPLLTRDLYHGFVATRKLESAESRLQALQYLISLLPTANRDTLYTLLKFLHLITKHSVDSVDSSGNMTQGNKMNAHNLATLFGPNILHKAKGGLEKQFQVDQVERAEERLQVISVVEEMVNHHEQLFQVAPSVHDEVFRVLLETNPEAVDFLMKRRLVMMVEPEHTSCYFDESDSSLPRSPVAMSDFEPQKLGTDRSTWLSLDAPKKPVVRIRSADPPLERETNQLQDRVGSMELGSWYRQESRSPSPRSPVIMRDSRNTEPKFRLSVPQHSVDRARSSSAESRSGGLSPKEAFMQRTSPSSSSIDSRLRVPFAYSREGSTSSLSSYPSPVSGSPGSVDFMSSHGFGSGHSTPSSLSSKNDQSDRETSTSPNPHAPLVKASSQQRPLGLVKPKPRPFSAIGFPDRRKDVQYDQWRKWENLARKSGDDFHEQETLV